MITEGKNDNSGTDEVKKLVRRKKKIRLLAIIICLAIIAVLVTIYIVGKNKSKSNSATSAYNASYNFDVKQINNNQTDPTQAIANLNGLLKLKLSTQQRYSALTLIAFGYQRQNNNSAALSAMLGAVKLEPSKVNTSVYANIANSYAQKGDKTDAITYYKKAIAAAQSKSAGPYDATYIPSYKQSITSLGGTP